MISFSGLGKLDLLLNQTKTKVLKCVSLLLAHIFEEMSVEEANMAPMSSKLVVLLPHLIESLALFATDRNLNSLIQDETNSELIVQMLDVVIIATG